MRLAYALAFALVACGDSKNGADGSNGASALLSTAPATPADCPAGGTTVSIGEDDNGNGVLDAAEVDDEFPICNGASGARGVAGTNGTDNHIADTHFCTGGLEATPLFFVYQVAVMVSGDVFAYGGIQGPSLQVGASMYYAAGQNGAADAAVIFTGDSVGTANGGWWDIRLNRTTGVTTIAYHDTEATGGLMSWTMPASACIVNHY